MKTKRVLVFFLVLMVGMVIFALVFPDQLRSLLNRPSLHRHVLFIHIVATTLFFANAVVGILWEHRSLASGRPVAILHTYETVTWLDARLSSPLIVVSVVAGIMLSTTYGDIWQVGWLSIAFLLFIFSGLVWVGSDIPTQYRVKRLIADADPLAPELPQELMRLLRLRLWVSIGGVSPLIIVFMLMVYKPDITPVAQWFR
ncbi:MAG: DUF2269 family protein [Spirochaetaceae bacterium]|nr:MAG: DUF2269 family protein [Spirochaetaceae bacterium]